VGATSSVTHKKRLNGRGFFYSNNNTKFTPRKMTIFGGGVSLTGVGLTYLWFQGYIEMNPLSVFPGVVARASETVTDNETDSEGEEERRPSQNVEDNYQKPPTLSQVFVNFIKDTALLIPSSIKEAASRAYETSIDFAKQNYHLGKERLQEMYYSFHDALPRAIKYPRVPFLVLPPELPKGYQPITVCVDVDLFIDPHPSTLRSGTEFFITHTSQFAEIVILYKHNIDILMEIMMEIDKASMVQFRLGPEHFFESYKKKSLASRYT